MTAVVEAIGLTKRFGSHVALSDCTLCIPAGQVVGLVGPNGAGKSTLLRLAAGMLRPTKGSIEVFGQPPSDAPEQLARVGFVAQDHPIYANMSVREHLEIGARLNPGWDGEYAARRVDQLGLDRRQRAGKLSGGQRAQLSITLAVAKRPELLLLDEPFASLDPLARRGLLENVMQSVADRSVSVVLSSHLVSDLERVCDYLVVVVSSLFVLAGEVDDIVATHHRLVGPSGDDSPSLEHQKVVHARHVGRQATVIVRSEGPVMDPGWLIEALSLEDVVLAYMAEGATDPVAHPQPAGAKVTWLAWRQFRLQALVAVVLLGGLAAYVLATGPHIAHLYDEFAPRCSTPAGCPAGTLANATRYLPLMNDVVSLVPVLIGMFWGAPMVAREIESGSIRLVLLQSISRSRWLWTKLALVGAGALVAGGLTSLLVSWWAGPWDRYNGLRFGTFDVRDLAPAGYCLFALALGAFVGAVVRRTIPAMALTVVGYAAVVGAFGEWVRPHLLGGETDNHYWAIQWTEASIFVAVAVVLGAATVWWVRRRLS